MDARQTSRTPPEHSPSAYDEGDWDDEPQREVEENNEVNQTAEEDEDE